jgi:hypothetical protein
MAERKVKVPFGESGAMADGVEVTVDESTERWSEYKFSDGSILRGKLTVTSAVRIEGQFDPQGHPMYAINMTPALLIAESPAHLRKK